MSSKVKVSVIVPVYNGQEYLREALNSLASQSFTDVEFVCVDDGSTDSTPEIIAEYAARDFRFKSITKSNTGFGDSMNVGIDAAAGVYVTSLDSDDLLSRDAIERMYQFAEEYELDFLKADRIDFEGEGPDESAPINKMGTRDEQYEEVFNPSVNPAAWMVKTGLPGMYRKSFLEKCGIRLNETPGASFQDTGLTAQALFNAKRARLLDAPVYYVRRDNEQRSTLDVNKVYCICDEHDFIRQKAFEAHGNVDACVKSAASMRFDGYEWNIGRIGEDRQEEFVERARKDFMVLREAGELDRAYFKPQKWEALELLFEHPMEYYAQRTYGRKLWHANRKISDQKRQIKAYEREVRGLKKENEKLVGKNNALIESTSYKVGRIVTWLPRTLRKHD